MFFWFSLLNSFHDSPRFGMCMTENFWVIGSFVQTVIKIQNCIANEFLIDLNLLMSDFKVSHINPKAPGLFGQLNTWGEM